MGEGAAEEERRVERDLVCEASAEIDLVRVGAADGVWASDAEVDCVLDRVPEEETVAEHQKPG